MAIYRIFPEKDTFIHRPYEGMLEDKISSAGMDPIVQLSPQSRILVKYDANDVQKAFIENHITPEPEQYTFYLRYYFANGFEVPENFNVEVYGLDENWNAGNGTFSDDPPNKTGATWNYKATGSTWGIDKDISGAIGESPNEADKIGFQSFVNYSKLDLKLEINQEVDYLTKFFPSGRDGETPPSDKGFLIKLDNEITGSNEPKSFTTLNYYSRDSHTIYGPCLEIAWDDSIFPTDENIKLITANSGEFFARIGNLQSEYNLYDVVKLNIHARLKNPERDYNNLASYTGGVRKVNYLLPETSWYQIIDKVTGEPVIEEHEIYTKLSADKNNNYFTLYCQNLHRQRYYCIEIYSRIDNYTKLVSTSNYFKIV